MPETVAWSRIPEDAAERWMVVRDVCAGDQALRGERVDPTDSPMVRRNVTYLPYLNKLDHSLANVERNRAYRERAVLYTATSFTRDGLLGLAFRFDPTDNLPAKLKYLLTDCDGAGTSIYQQSQASLGNVVEVGRHGLYVDFSQALNRPVIKAYCAEAIINWRETQVDGQTILTMIVLREEIEVDDGYAVVCVPQYRELRLVDGVCTCKIWQDGEKANDPPIQQQMKDANGEPTDELVLRSSGGPLDYIPVHFIGSESNNANINPSPLYGLAKLNVAHFRNSADYEDSVFYTGQVQPWISGLTEEWRDNLQEKGLYIGSRTVIPLPAGGGFGFAQAQPNTLAKEAMDQKEAQMVALGARIIEAKLANKTATGEDNDREASTSVLALCCSNVTEAYQASIRSCGRYLDMDTTAEEFASTYKINQQFVKASANPQIMAQLVSAWQTGIMAKTDVRAFFKLQGVLATERTDEQIEADLETEGPSLGAVRTTINDDVTNLPAYPGASIPAGVPTAPKPPASTAPASKGG